MDALILTHSPIISSGVVAVEMLDNFAFLKLFALKMNGLVNFNRNMVVKGPNTKVLCFSVLIFDF